MNNPKQYTKKPVTIEAWKLTESMRHEVAKWCGGKVVTEQVWALNDDYDKTVLEIPTLEGVMRADIGDFIIKGVAGEFYSCRSDIFEQTYEETQGE